MSISGSIFKAYDVRGLYPGEINEETARLIGRAFVAYLGAGRIAVSRDMRVSSPTLATVLAVVFAEVDCGWVPYVKEQVDNNYLRQVTGFQRTTLAGRNALATTLTGRSPLTGRSERVTLITTQLGNGQVFYMAAVSPQSEYTTYQRAFNDILRSLRLNTRY